MLASWLVVAIRAPLTLISGGSSLAPTRDERALATALVVVLLEQPAAATRMQIKTMLTQGRKDAKASGRRKPPDSAALPGDSRPPLARLRASVPVREIPSAIERLDRPAVGDEIRPAERIG